MRILWHIHLYPPQHNCGSEYVAHSLNKYLISKGHQVRVILERYKGIPFVYEGVEIFPGTNKRDPFAWADVLMTHLDMTQATCLVQMEVKKPLIHFIHNDIKYSCIDGGMRGHHVVYNSQWTKDRIGYRWPGIVLHPPCNADYYDVGDERGDHITLISLNEMKGGFLFREIAKAMPNRKFIGVVGSYENKGPENLAQEFIIKLLQELPNVTIVPNSPDILSVYKKTRILLMPSYYESWGRTATEAMCSGIPVICTPTAGLLENCSYAGTYVGEQLAEQPPGDIQVDIGTVKEWVQAIEEVDKDYAKKSVNCRARATELNPISELEAVEDFIQKARF